MVILRTIIGHKMKTSKKEGMDQNPYTKQKIT